MKNEFLDHIAVLQEKITTSIEKIDGEGKFIEDIWKRPEGGGGKSRVMENGKIFEKAGVNSSAVTGILPKSLESYFKVKDSNFFACGLSLVIHPKNPMIPTVHANYRYFELYYKNGKLKDQWFGGGQDLTPFYLIEEDAIHFHRICKSVCEKHSASFYKIFKEKCDLYFWNHHRKEARGIGGIFFDYEKKNWVKDFKFVRELGLGFIDISKKIINRKNNFVWTKKDKEKQLLKRGRYVEFNLLYDRGTKFGLNSGGNIESILMSLPPSAKWK